MSDALTSKEEAEDLLSAYEAQWEAGVRMVMRGFHSRAELDAARNAMDESRAAIIAAMTRTPPEANGCPACDGAGNISDSNRISICANCDGTGRIPHEPSGWQPIETAPHMRKIMVSYLNALGKRRVVLACYYEPNALEMHDDYQDVGVWDEASGTLFAPAGWYEEHESEEPLMPLSNEPDFWQPLPSAPSTKSEPFCIFEDCDQRQTHGPYCQGHHEQEQRISKETGDRP